MARRVLGRRNLNYGDGPPRILAYASTSHPVAARTTTMTSHTPSIVQCRMQCLLPNWISKRQLSSLPKGRQQIGKFGIGKLATYVLANRLTHISKCGKKYFSTSMDYGTIDRRIDQQVEPKSPIQLALRELTESQTRSGEVMAFSYMCLGDSPTLTMDTSEYLRMNSDMERLVDSA